MGWFYGFKLHLIINDKGEILDFRLTPGNTNDRLPLYGKRFTEKLFGKLVADKGYISQSLFEYLFIEDVHLITHKKKNMKNSLMLQYDKVLLRKRVLIESVNDELKNICQIEHTRHRSIHNFAANLVAGLIAYQTLDKKPSLNLELIKKTEFGRLNLYRTQVYFSLCVPYLLLLTRLGLVKIVGLSMSFKPHI